MSGFLPTFRGALVKKSTDDVAANYTAGVNLTWDAETYDYGGFHDTVTNNTRLTIPAGVSLVRIGCQAWIQNNNVDTYANLVIMKAGSQGYDGSASCLAEVGLTTVTPQVWTPTIPVVAGDYFEANLLVESDTSINILAARSWFAIEVLG